jgi:Flp pilus assembly pilin Flp
MGRLLARILRDEEGQDLVEYALLATFLGLISIAVFGQVQAAIKSTYLSWNTNNNSNWQMPDPGSGS